MRNYQLLKKDCDLRISKLVTELVSNAVALTINANIHYVYSRAVSNVSANNSKGLPTWKQILR